MSAFLTVDCDREGCKALIEFDVFSSIAVRSVAEMYGWVTIRDMDYCPKHAGSAVAGVGNA